MTFRFGLYGRAELSPGAIVASPPAARAVKSNVIVVAPWLLAPQVGYLAWIEHYAGDTPQVSGCSYDIRDIGVAAIGTADVTAAALLGGSGTLNGLTLKLSVDGAAEQTLTLVGADNAASTDSLLAAILTKWPSLWQVGLGGASLNVLLLAAQSLVVGAGTANAALGLTAGVPSSVSVLLDRSIVWEHTIGDRFICAPSHPKDIELDFTGAAVSGYANQPIEFTQAQRVMVTGLNYKLSTDQIPDLGGAEGLATLAFDVASRDCVFKDSTIEFPNDPPYAGSNGIYCQSNDGTLIQNVRIRNARAQGYSFMDCYASNAISNVTSDCAWGHVFQRFDDSSFGCLDCACIACNDIGSNVGQWVWGANRVKTVAFSSTKNSQYGLLVDRDCGATSYTNCSYTKADTGVYIAAGVNGTSFTQLNTDESRVGIIIAGSTLVSQWHHHSANSSPTSLCAFVSGYGPNVFRDIDLKNTAGGNGIDIQSTGTVVIDGGKIEVGGTGYCIQVETNAHVRLCNLVLVGGLGISCSAGSVEIGPGCDFSAITETSQFILSGSGKVTFQQTGGTLIYNTSNHFILLADCYNTVIEVPTGAPGTAIGLPGIPGLQFTVVNGTAGAMTVISRASGDAGISIAAGKTAIVRVDSTNHCKRVTPDL
jgi:hypothetical protein